MLGCRTEAARSKIGMKIPLDFFCDKCGRELHFKVDIATPNPDIVCPCGKTKLKVLVGSTGPDSFPGLVLDRAGYELQNGDYTMTILLSAIAVETLISGSTVDSSSRFAERRYPSNV